MDWIERVCRLGSIYLHPYHVLLKRKDSTKEHEHERRIIDIERMNSIFFLNKDLYSEKNYRKQCFKIKEIENEKLVTL